MGNLRDKVARERKRRKKRQRDGRVSSELIRLKATALEQRAFTALHSGIALAIEKTLTSVALDGGFDDRDVADAIRGTLHGIQPTGSGGRRLAIELERARLECDSDESLWQDGLRVIYRSLVTRSKCRRDELSYLFVAAGFVAKAG